MEMKSNRNSNECRFFNPPSDPSGYQIDLSDRPIICASTSRNQDEVVFGGADHALYAVSISTSSGIGSSSSNSGRGSNVIKMHSKRCGHSNWVTSVTHLKDNRVLSASMDGKLCLWGANRSICIDLLGHSKSVSKVVASDTFNIALSCSYDSNLILWNFKEPSRDSDGRSTTGRGIRSSSSSSSSLPQSTVLTGHTDPVIECCLGSYDSNSSNNNSNSNNCNNNIAASGDRTGNLILWDLNTCSYIRRIKRAHRGSITALIAVGNDIMTGGVDGMVRLWDAREGKKSNSVLMILMILIIIMILIMMMMIMI